MRSDELFDAFLKHEPFYYPFVRVQFDAGMRPSETVALTWADAASFRVDYWDRVLDALKIRKRKF